jgi:repressor LexA
LQIIEDSLTQRGYVPTLQEMAHATGIASLHGVKRHLAALERKGYLRRFSGRRRALEIIHRVVPLEGSSPILGRVAAGRPVLAVENHEGVLSLGPALLGEEATVKRLRKEGQRLFLEAANAAYAPIPLTRQSPAPRILGTVVGVYQDRRRRR